MGNVAIKMNANVSQDGRVKGAVSVEDLVGALDIVMEVLKLVLVMESVWNKIFVDAIQIGGVMIVEEGEDIVMVIITMILVFVLVTEDVEEKMFVNVIQNGKDQSADREDVQTVTTSVLELMTDVIMFVLVMGTVLL